MTIHTNQQKVPSLLRSWQIFTGRVSRYREDARGFHAPFMERWLLLIVVDALCILLALRGVSLLSSGETYLTFHLLEQTVAVPFSLLMLVGWWILAYFTDLYDIPASCDRAPTVFSVLATGVLTVMTLLLIQFVWPLLLPTRFLLYLALAAMPLVMIWRLLYIRFSWYLFSAHRILILGYEPSGQLIERLLKRSARLNFQTVGYLSDTPTGTRIPLHDTLPVLGKVQELTRLTQEYQIDEVVVAITEKLTPDLFQLLVDCQAQGVQVSWMADLHEKLGRSIPIQYIDPTWALCAMQGQPIFNRLQLAGKRILDLLFICLALPTILPIMLLVALAVRLDSPGPIFYQQVRVGRGGKLYTIYKFRTMIPNAEQKGQAQWAADNDPRITRMGRLLRKARLDELPQLYNILTGDMSLVGPRPERPEFVDLLQEELPFYRTRLLVKPGLTGWAQIHYDYANSIEDTLYKLQYDFYYVRYWSLRLDLYTMFKTVFVVLKLKGA